MAEQGNNILLGLNIDEKAVRVVRSAKTDDGYQFPIVFSGNLAYPINIETIKNREMISEISTDVESLLSKNVVIEGDIGLALDRDLVLLKQISVDDDLSDAEILDHVEWELEQFLISSRDEYNVAFEKIARIQNNMQNILLVCVRTTIIDFLKDIFSQTIFNLTSVDVDLFAEARAIKAFYSDKMSGYSALISIHGEAVALLFLKDGEVLSWSDIPNSAEFLPGHNEQGEALVDLLNSELDTKLKSLGIEEGVDKLDVLFLDGKVDISLFSSFQSKNSAEIVLVDPYEKTPENGDDNPLAENMLAAIGMSIVEE
jgi:Tfp pilus assembly PilM family ATPase